jgi:hypothetical protein
METVKVRFNNCEEFLEEISARPPTDKLVRITQRYTSSGFSPAVKHVAVIATYYRSHDRDGNPCQCVVQLERYIGDDWGHDATGTKSVPVKAEETVKLLSANCEKMGLKVGAGVLEL